MEDEEDAKGELAPPDVVELNDAFFYLTPSPPPARGSPPERERGRLHHVHPVLRPRSAAHRLRPLHAPGSPPPADVRHRRTHPARARVPNARARALPYSARGARPARAFARASAATHGRGEGGDGARAAAAGGAARCAAREGGAGCSAPAEADAAAQHHLPRSAAALQEGARGQRPREGARKGTARREGEGAAQEEEAQPLLPHRTQSAARRPRPARIPRPLLPRLPSPSSSSSRSPDLPVANVAHPARPLLPPARLGAASLHSAAVVRRREGVDCAGLCGAWCWR